MPTGDILHPWNEVIRSVVCLSVNDQSPQRSVSHTSLDASAAKEASIGSIGLQRQTIHPEGDVTWTEYIHSVSLTVD